MVAFAVGDEVKVSMPKGKNKRGVMGVSVMYTTSQEAKFEGATGTVTEINPRGPYEIPLYLVDFKTHQNRVSIPWSAQWFREEWIVGTKPREEVKPQPADSTAPTGMAQTATGERPN